MSTGFKALAALTYRLEAAHRQILDSTGGLPDQELRRNRGKTVPSIAFHLWHIGRWTDRVQALVGSTLAAKQPAGKTAEIWSAEELASRWNLNADELGEAESGMGMGDELAGDIDLPLPETRGYTQRAMALLKQRLDEMSENDLGIRTTDLYERESSLGTVLLSHLTHIDRHLGMIEALRGVAGLSGTATV